MKLAIDFLKKTFEKSPEAERVNHVLNSGLSYIYKAGGTPTYQ